MTQALHAGMLDEVAGLRADLRRLTAEGTNVREDTVITRLAAFQCDQHSIGGEAAMSDRSTELGFERTVCDCGA